MDHQTAAPGGQLLGQGEDLFLGLFGGVGIGEEVDHIQGNTPLGDHPGGHGGIDAAREEGHRPAVDPHRQTAGARLGIGVDIGRRVPHFQMDGQLGVVDIHLEVGVALVQLAAHPLGQLNGGHGEGLVGPLGLHLKGFRTGEFLPQVGAGRLQHLLLGLAAGSGPGQTHDAEHPAHGLIGPVHVAVGALGLHVHGGLLGVHLELAQGAETALGVGDEFILKPAAVQALEHQLAQLEQNDFFHNRFLSGPFHLVRYIISDLQA